MQQFNMRLKLWQHWTALNYKPLAVNILGGTVEA